MTNHINDALLAIETRIADDDDLALLLRDALTYDDDDALPYDDATTDDAIALLDAIDTIRSDRDAVSTLRLELSLCPIHCCDYAICFDDDDDECASIRSAFPSHDT